MPTSFAFTGDGSQVAIAGIADDSRPGLIGRYAALGGFGGESTSEHKKQLKELERQLKFQVVCATLSIEPGATAKKIFCMESFDFSATAHWINEGKTLAVMVEGKVYKP